jgi:hypothetical protein
MPPFAPIAFPSPFEKDDMSQLEDEAALNAAWAVLRKHDVPDGLLGVYYLQTHETFVLHYEEEGSPYFEWVRLAIPNLAHTHARGSRRATRQTHGDHAAQVYRPAQKFASMNRSTSSIRRVHH